MAAREEQQVDELYEFGPFRVDADRELLLRDGVPVAVTPKTFQILLVLLRGGQKVVTKDDLMKEVWPDTFVEEANLSRNIFLLRKALGESPNDRRYIVTVPGRGYRLAGNPRRINGPEVAVVAATHSEVEIEVEESHSPRWISIGVVALLLLGVIAWWFAFHRTPALTARDTVVLADFVNGTSDPVFDETLRQGLKVQLEQSPYLSIASDSLVQETLKLMGRQPDTRLTADVAREICERSGGAAVLSGSMMPLGSRYVLGLEAKNCRTGATLDDEQAEATKKEDVLRVLSSIASRFRTRVGESLVSVEKYSTPLEQATTTSLEALKAYSTGVRVSFTSGFESGIPFLERAIAIDPQFALAYAHLGLWYSAAGESAKSIESTKKAYALRDHASESERLFIVALYERDALGNLDASYQTLQQWAQAYPRVPHVHALISGFSSQGTGRYEESIVQAQRALELDPSFTPAYVNIAYSEFYRDRIDATEAALRRAADHQVETPEILVLRYHIAFLRGDTAEMDRVSTLAKGKEGADDWLLHCQSLVSANAGRLREAREKVGRAVAVNRLEHQTGRAAKFIAARAVWEALFGNSDEARRQAVAALNLSNDADVEFASAFALAYSGEIAQAKTLAASLESHFPENTSVQFNYLPALRALIALREGSPEKALEVLRAAAAYESAVDSLDFNNFFGGVYPMYLRADAYAAQGKDAEASAEFEKLLSHKGLLAADPIGRLALLGSARCYARMNQVAKAKSTYEQLLRVWGNADSDLRLLRQARAEYNGLAATGSR